MTFGQYHPDTVIVDRLTAFLNREQEPSGADAIDLIHQLISASGRPLLSETWDIDTDLVEDRFGLLTGVVTAAGYTVRVFQPTDGSADLRIEVTTEDGDDFGLAIAVDGRLVLEAMPCTWTSTVPKDLQLTKETRRRWPLSCLRCTGCHGMRVTRHGRMAR